MAKLRIPCLVGKPNKDGTFRWYWQPSATLAKAGWKTLKLGNDEGEAIAAARKRNQEVEDWKVKGVLPAEEKVQERKLQGTVGALVERYRREYVNGTDPATGKPYCKPKTIESYETSLKRIEAWAGSQPLAYVTPARVTELRNKTAMPREGGGLGHSSALNLLKTVRQLFAFAESVDLMSKGSNPATDFNLGQPKPRKLIWEAEDEAAFIAAAYDLNMPLMALAIELAIYSGQREGDLIAFNEAQWQALMIHEPALRKMFADKNGRVMGWSLLQEKGSQGRGSDNDDGDGTLLEIPFEPTLRAKVEKALRDNRARDRAAEPRRLLTHVLVDHRGLPWKMRAFYDAWRDVISHAVKMTGRTRMHKLVWHDLRRTRVVRLRRRGMDPAMIASITGHSPQSIFMMLKVYGPIDPTITAAAIASSLEPTKTTSAKTAKAPSKAKARKGHLRVV